MTWAAYDTQENFLERKLFSRCRHGRFTRQCTCQSRSSLRLHTSAQLFERALSHQSAAMDDGEVTTKTLDNFEHVRSEENRGAASNHALKHGFECAGCNSVHTFEWLIEKKHSGSMNNGAGHCQFLLHTVRVVGDESFRLIGELHEIEQFGGALASGFAVEAVHAADEIQIFSAS